VQSEAPVLAGHENETIRISTISFAFRNAKLLHLLTQRGTAVNNAQVDKLPKIDEQINSIKEAEKDTLRVPVTAFITFETQEGYERACNIKAKRNWLCRLNYEQEFLDAPLYFREAPEPTNIIWENRQVTFFQQIIRTIIVIAIILVLFVGCLFVFYYLKKTTVTNYQRYPPSTNCNSINSLFNNQLSTAYIENAYEDLQLIQQQNHGIGIYQCFCNKVRDDFGYIGAKGKEFYVHGQNRAICD